MAKLKKLVKAIARGHGRKTEGRMLEWIDEYLVPRGDRRGRKTADLREAEKVLRHVAGAMKWQAQPDLDVNIRQEAKAVVTTARHAHVPFEEFKARPSRLRGRVNRDGRVRNARQPVRDCEPLRIELRGGRWVERMHTTGMLAGGGRELGNCAKDNAYGLHDRLRQRESDFYVVGRGDHAEAMFEVDLETDSITEFFGNGNAEVRFPLYQVLYPMLRTLRLNGDDVETCLQQGAASIFVTRRAKRWKPDYHSGAVRVWCARRHLVIKEGKGLSGRWSSFRGDGDDDWDPSPASYRHNLNSLVTRHPQIAVLANKAYRTRAKVRRAPRRRQ